MSRWSLEIREKEMQGLLSDSTFSSPGTHTTGDSKTILSILTEGK